MTTIYYMREKINKYDKNKTWPYHISLRAKTDSLIVPFTTPTRHAEWKKLRSDEKKNEKKPESERNPPSTPLSLV